MSRKWPLYLDELVKETVEKLSTNGDVSRQDVEDSLTDALEGEINIREEARAKAKRLLRAHLTPGHSEPYGRVRIAGRLYAYEPYRLVASRDLTRISLLCHASLEFKDAEAERAINHKLIADERAELKTNEAKTMRTWVDRRTLDGWPPSKLSWENCIHDLKLWSEGDAPAEPSTDEDE